MFNISDFMGATFKERTKKIEVTSLAKFFDKGEKPIFVVRGLTGEELGAVNEASSKLQNYATIIEGLLGDSAKDTVQAIRASLGIECDPPADIAKRLQMLVIASVEPKISLEVAVKICRVCPVDFYVITNAIKDLTGQGALLGK